MSSYRYLTNITILIGFFLIQLNVTDKQIDGQYEGAMPPDHKSKNNHNRYFDKHKLISKHNLIPDVNKPTATSFA